MSDLLRIKAESLLLYTTEELFNNLEGDFILVFRDKEVTSNEKEVCFSSFCWDLFRAYPDTPILSKHLVSSVYKNGEMPNNGTLTLLNNVLWSVYDTYVTTYTDRQLLLDDLAKRAYDIVNDLYNDLSYRLEEYASTIDILDFIQVTKSANVVKILDAMDLTQESMDKTTKALEDQIRTSPEFKNNPLAISARVGTSRLAQVLQCIGPRGFLTDIDSNIYARPIKSSYISGIRTLYDSAIESRSAAKSLTNSEKPLQSSQYFSRRQQLNCMNIATLHFGDCGSTHYLLWNIRDARFEGPTQTGSCDLNTLEGKYYLNEETNRLEIIRKTDTHLIGKTVKLRSVIAGCNHPDPNGVCEVCFGEMSLSVPKNSNLGHLTCITMTSILSQLILSTKHFDGSSTVEGIVLKPFEKKYLHAETNGNSYYLNKNLSNKNVEISIPSSNAIGLPDVKRIDDINKLNITRVSEFSVMKIKVTDNEGEGTEEAVNVFVNNRRSSFTHDFLSFIKEKGYSINDELFYVFNLDGWDYDKPITTLPMRHYNMGDLQTEIANLLESTSKDVDKRNTLVSPDAMLFELHDLVNKRLQINISILEVILYSSMIVDAATYNYDLPKPWTTKGLGVLKQLMLQRSLSGQMAYQNHRVTYLEPLSYINTNRLNHVFDCILLPKEVLSELR